MPLIDRYGRPIENLRITLTHQCNYKCIYCHMEGEEPSHEELTPEEIERVVKATVKLGIKRVKFTGGEPLIRKDLPEIIEKTSNIEGLVDVAVTTNGSLLKQMAKRLAEAKLKRINVNLPSIREETYRKITNSEYTPKQILEGIMEAKRFGIKLIKVNMVVLKGINDNEIYDLMEYVKRENLILQLIELENVGINNEFFLKH
ncbi:MAG: GTP 3',8-cyclase MoaA, partial [Candidatus Methanomethylicia archaeon]